MFLKLFLVNLFRSLLLFLLQLLPSPKFIMIKQGKTSSLPKVENDKLEMIKKTFPDLMPHIDADFRIKDSFKGVRSYINRQLLRCTQYVRRLDDDRYVAALLVPLCDEYGVLTFPMNIPNKDEQFYRWNRMAGTLVTARGLLKHEEIDLAIERLTMAGSENSLIVKKMKDAKARIKGSSKLAYDVANDRIISRW